MPIIPIVDIKKEVEQLYDPATAFGNKDLVTKIKIAENIAEEEKARKACGRCDHRGMVEEECEDCDGEGTVTCSDCDGIGRAHVKCDHS